MPDGQSLEFSGVTKRFGAVTAVSELTARVEPGQVTGFLGPNGAGKTTTLRILLGLVRATHGTATIGGLPYAKLDRPLQSVGAVLEASSFHPGRTAANHLLVYAQAAGIANGRVDEVLGLVGLADAAGRKVGGFSLGMRQRLGLAYALLGDPGVLVLDEPANGLDPEGIRWMRGFLRELAQEGRTVLVSSHLLAEVQQTVDALLIISAGRLVFQGSLDELADPSEYATVVDAPDRAALSAALTAADVPFEVLRSGLTVRGADPTAVGAAATAGGVALSTLHRRGPALEEVFLDLVNGTRVHASAAGSAVGAGAAVGAAAGVTETDAAAAPTAAEEPVAAVPAQSAAETDAAAQDETDIPVEGKDPAAAGVVPGLAAAAGDAGAQRESHDEAPDDAARAEDAESALVSAEPDAETTGAPGAATALGAAAGAAWAAAAAGDDRSDERADAEHATFSVASTGIIDVVPDTSTAEPDGSPEPPSAGEPEPLPAPEDADPDVEAIGDIDDELTSTESGPGQWADAEHPTFAVAGTGVIDVVPAAAAADPPADADPDPEAIGGIDEELAITSPPETDDRPWESHEKTDADVEADRFFAAFDATAEGGTDDGSERPNSPRPSDGRGGEPEPAQGHETEASVTPEEQGDERGTLADLSPDWVETDVDDSRRDEGGER